MTYTLTKWDESVDTDPQDEYQNLVRSLTWINGFGIFFIRCSPAKGDQLIEQIAKDVPKTIKVLTLEEPIKELYNLIDWIPDKEEIDVLIIKGIEKSLIEYIRPGYGGQGDYYNVDSVPRILGHLNLQRERFRDSFDFSIVFILPLFAFKYFIHRAPDFFDWRSGIFEFPTQETLLHDEIDYLLGGSISPEKLKSLALSDQEHHRLVLELNSLAEDCTSVASNCLVQFIKGHCSSLRNDHEKVLASYEQILLLNPNDHEAWYIRGLSLHYLGRQADAIDSYDKALNINPNYHEAWFNRGISLFLLNQHEEAIMSHNKCLQIDSQNDEAWVARGMSLAILGRFEEAITSYNEALHINPSYCRAWQNSGVALAMLGRYEEATISFNQALEINPNDYLTWSNHGNALGYLGLYEEAMTSFEQALMIKPENKFTLQNRERIQKKWEQSKFEKDSN